MLTMGSWVLELLREPERLLIAVDEAERLSGVHGIPFYAEVLVPLWRASAWLKGARIVEGVTLMRTGLEKWNALGARAGVAWKAMLAEGLACIIHESGE